MAPLCMDTLYWRFRHVSQVGYKFISLHFDPIEYKSSTWYERDQRRLERFLLNLLSYHMCICHIWFIRSLVLMVQCVKSFLAVGKGIYICLNTVRYRRLVNINSKFCNCNLLCNSILHWITWDMCHLLLLYVQSRVFSYLGYMGLFLKRYTCACASCVTTRFIYAFISEHFLSSTVASCSSAYYWWFHSQGPGLVSKGICFLWKSYIYLWCSLSTA